MNSGWISIRIHDIEIELFKSISEIIFYNYITDYSVKIIIFIYSISLYSNEFPIYSIYLNRKMVNWMKINIMKYISIITWIIKNSKSANVILNTHSNLNEYWNNYNDKLVMNRIHWK